MPRRRLFAMTRTHAIAMLAACACAWSCAGRPDEPRASRAFYYWRTTFQLSDSEQRALADLHVNRLYIRMFDLDWRDEPSVVGPLAAAPSRVPAGIEAVPVVFVKEQLFRHVDTARVHRIAELAWREIQTRATLVGFTPREIQLDCDWTDSTRDVYFAFVADLRALSHLPMSATIRLHQIKYRERTGVPPVDRGMLMFYNMGRFSADPDARMIFDADSAEKYVARIADYPLPLDVALPIWSWTLHVRDDQVIELMQSTDPDELASSPYLTRAGDGRYTVTDNVFLHGRMLRAGDVLKVEVTGPAETHAAAELVASHLARAQTSSGARTLALFDLSERNLTRHGVDALDHVYRAVH